MDKHAFIAKYGPWAVVTGASSGIGLAIATDLAELDLALYWWPVASHYFGGSPKTL